MPLADVAQMVFGLHRLGGDDRREAADKLAAAGSRDRGPTVSGRYGRGEPCPRTIIDPSRDVRLASERVWPGRASDRGPGRQRNG